MESQEFIRTAMSEAMGIYLEKEKSPKYADTWRDMDIYGLTSHLAHEVEEIRAHSPTLAAIYHNALDAINLSAMIAAKARLESLELK